MVDHLEDLEADFLVYYRIKNIYKLEARKFFSLAYRVSAYPGVMAALMEAQEYERNGGSTRSTSGRSTKRVEGTSANLQNNPAFQANGAFPAVFEKFKEE